VTRSIVIESKRAPPLCQFEAATQCDSGSHHTL